jgi:hypothetical protein
MLAPNSYSPRAAEQLLWYLIQELKRTRGDRNQLESDWIRYEQTYRARPIDMVKEFPFHGASNLVIPVMATDTDTLFSRLMGLLFEQPGLWTVSARRPEMEEIAPRLEEFLTWAQENECEMQGPVGDYLLDLMKLGTGILKERYDRQQKKVYEWRELDRGIWQQQALVLLRDAPRTHRVRLHNFFVPAGFKELEDMPWCCENIEMTWMQFLNRVRAGVYAMPNALAGYNYSGDYGYYQQPVQQAYDEFSHYKASIRNQFCLKEFWTEYDIDEDGEPEALVCTIHEESQSYVRIDYNPFFNQEKPYVASRFMRDGNSFYGIGLGEMLDMFQEEITAMHNQRIDAGTIGNSTMIATTKDNTNISDEEPIWPGKNWRVNKTDDIKVFGLGNPGAIASSIQMEGATLQWSQRRDGVNDYVMGNPSPETGYGTAYTTQQMLLNATRRLGETVREVQRGLGIIGTYKLELYQQFNQRGKEFFALGQQDGALVRMVLQFPLDLIRRGLKVSVRAIDVTNSKDMQIRTNTLVFQQIVGFYGQYLQLLQLLMNPQLPPQFKAIVQQMIDGISLTMRRILESYNVQDASTLIPDLAGAQADFQRQLSALQAALLASPGSRFPSAAGGTPYGPAGTPPNAGMGNLPPAVGGAAGNGFGQAPVGQGPYGGLPSPGGVGYGGAGIGANPSY